MFFPGFGTRLALWPEKGTFDRNEIRIKMIEYKSGYAR